MEAVADPIPAMAVARPIAGLLAETAFAARVLAAFDRSCYLETPGGAVIALLHPRLGRGAFALTLARDVSFVRLAAGMPATRAGDLLRAGDRVIRLDTAREWDPTLPPRVSPITGALQAIEDVLRAEAPSEGLSRVVFGDESTPLLRRGRAGLDDLRRGLAGRDARALRGGVETLAGLGPGLTPSGDDVLAGLLLAMHLWPGAAGAMTRDEAAPLIIDGASGRTGRISRAYLAAAARGHASDAWHDLVASVSRGVEAIASAAGRILLVGETSGADMLAGLVFGLRLGVAQQGVGTAITAQTAPGG